MIHQYKLNGYNIVLDINSGSIHVPDPLAYEAIRLIDESAGQKSNEEIGRELLHIFSGQGVTQEEIQETSLSHHIHSLGQIKKGIII